MKHFIDINEYNAAELHEILALAKQLKNDSKAGKAHPVLAGKQLAMIFEKPSTRTRVSFEVGINQLGGNAVILQSDSSQIGRGEPILDTSSVLSRYVDIMMIRCFEHHSATELAKHASVPVINGLTNQSHPCQVMADILTIEEYLGSIEEQIVTWVGDGNNMTHSWLHAAEILGFELRIATPEALAADAAIIASAKAKNNKILVTHDPKEAAKDATVITTDTWVSMGDKDAQERQKLLAPYQVDNALFSQAQDHAIFLHCLPAHREEEVTSEIIDGPASKIYDEAENRLHIQKAIMVWCMQS